MENDEAAPLLVVGQMPDKCYATTQEFVQDLAQVLRVPSDTIAVIKGATGEKGQKGDRGDRGTKGEKGDGAISNIQRYAIPIDVKSVDIPYFDQWEKAHYKVGFNGMIGGGGNPFDPAVSGVVGIGTVIQVYATPAIQFLRCFFVFAGGIDKVPTTGHILIVTDVR